VSWRTLGSRVVYENQRLRVREDDVVQPDGSPGVYSVVELADFAVVVPFDGEAYTLVEQFRYPVGGRYWEFPMGARHGGDDDPVETARRELAEETGLRAGTLTHLGRLHHAYGVATHSFDVYLGEQLEQGERSLDGTELDMVVGRFTLDEIRSMVAAGRITDAPTLAALGLFLLDG
jgi:8-oxo-dGTP pyrophosphatase MutT (NUDIX family)